MYFVFWVTAYFSRLMEAHAIPRRGKLFKDYVTVPVRPFVLLPAVNMSE